ncbi:MAG: tricarballylate/proton symporter TcuC [Acidobacteriota bacterium]
MASSRQSAPRATNLRRILRVASGNALEMYDFQIFGFYAPAIAHIFFPSTSEYASLMLSLSTFGAGFLMRPLGAIVLGSYIDNHGRRAGLLLSLSLMAFGTFSIACLPGYAAIGLAAPLLVLLGRLLQGFSAGVELGGVAVYLSEIAPPGQKGFYVSWQSGSQQAAVMFTSASGIALAAYFSADQMAAWGWRIPLLAGCLLLPLLLFLRRSLEETPEFLARKRHPKIREILDSVLANWRIVLLGMMMSTFSTVSYYLATVYTPTYGGAELHLPPTGTLLVTLAVGLSSFILLPSSGALSDRIGRRPIVILSTAAAILTAYPALAWLSAAPSIQRLLAVEVWFAFLFAAYQGAMSPLLVEIMPVGMRTTGFALAYSLATAVFGGFTPAICTYLIHATGNRAMPGVWLSMAAAIALTAVLIVTGRSSSLTNVPVTQIPADNVQ